MKRHFYKIFILFFLGSFFQTLLASEDPSASRKRRRRRSSLKDTPSQKCTAAATVKAEKTEEKKKTERARRNKISAYKYREKKRARMAFLEIENEKMKEIIAEQERRIALLKAQIPADIDAKLIRLRERNAELEARNQILEKSNKILLNASAPPAVSLKEKASMTITFNVTSPGKQQKATVHSSPEHRAALDALLLLSPEKGDHNEADDKSLEDLLAELGSPLSTGKARDQLQFDKSPQAAAATTKPWQDNQW